MLILPLNFKEFALSDKTIFSRLIKITMSKLTTWIHNYISMQDCLEHIDAKQHSVFYSACQAFFYLFIARHEEFLKWKDGESAFISFTHIIYLTMTILRICILFSGILFLQEFNIPRIVTCKLNPLEICDSKIVQSFADITSMYQLAYCYTVIENNERSQLPIFGIQTRLSLSISNFFPFESYNLQYSGQRILPLFRSNIVNTARLTKDCE